MRRLLIFASVLVLAVALAACESSRTVQGSGGSGGGSAGSFKIGLPF